MSKKLTYNYVKEQIEKTGYKLLSKEYVNNRQKLNYICPKGHRHSVSWDHWGGGRRCPYCASLGKPTIGFIKSEFKKEGYILLTRGYKNAHQKLNYICPKGHKHSINWNNWQQRQRCPYCANRPPITTEFIRSGFAKEGYKLLTEKYINCKQKLYYICPKGHKHSIRWSDWKTGCRCPYCVIITSKGEIQVRNFVKSLGVEILANDRSQIFSPFTSYRLELDIFIPNLNKAIEYNGEYWHSSKEAVRRDKIKIEQCAKKSIKLLVIKERDWIDNKTNCINKIKDFVKDKTILSHSRTT